MIPLFKVNMHPTAGTKVQEVLSSGMIGEGPKVIEFTNKLQELFQHEHVTPLNSCTSALELALYIATKHCPEGKIIAPTFTFPATNTAVRGKEILFIAPEKETFCASVEDIINTIYSGNLISTVVITLVGGVVPKDFDELVRVTRGLNLPLIVDAAHALTTTYKGHHISYWADMCCFSFQAIKHLTTGDGGAITCRSSANHELVSRLKWFGMDRNIPEGKTRLQHQMEYSIPEAGYKFHMNDISATIGLANFETALKAVKTSQNNANFYQKSLQNIKEIIPLKIPNECQPSWWAYGVWVKTSFHKKIMKALEENNIQSSSLWRPNHLHNCFAYDDCILPQDIFIEQTPLFLPNGFWVTSDIRIKIVSIIKESLHD